MSLCHKGSSRKRAPPYDLSRCGSMAEQLICNQQVEGSSPPIGSLAFMRENIIKDMGGFPSGQRGQTVNLLQLASVVRIHLHPLFFFFTKENHPKGYIAGWSSLEARWAHNPKVGGSNPPPATIHYAQIAQ